LWNANDLSKNLPLSGPSVAGFFLGLAKRATPVIEVGASKEITVVEGKELEVREAEG